MTKELPPTTSGGKRNPQRHQIVNEANDRGRGRDRSFNRTGWFCTHGKAHVIALLQDGRAQGTYRSYTALCKSSSFVWTARCRKEAAKTRRFSCCNDPWSREGAIRHFGRAFHVHVFTVSKWAQDWPAVVSITYTTNTSGRRGDQPDSFWQNYAVCILYLIAVRHLRCSLGHCGIVQQRFDTCPRSEYIFATHFIEHNHTWAEIGALFVGDIVHCLADLASFRGCLTNVKTLKTREEKHVLYQTCAS